MDFRRWQVRLPSLPCDAWCLRHYSEATSEAVLYRERRGRGRLYFELCVLHVLTVHRAVGAQQGLGAVRGVRPPVASPPSFPGVLGRLGCPRFAGPGVVISVSSPTCAGPGVVISVSSPTCVGPGVVISVSSPTCAGQGMISVSSPTCAGRGGLIIMYRLTCPPDAAVISLCCPGGAVISLCCPGGTVISLCCPDGVVISLCCPGRAVISLCCPRRAVISLCCPTRIVSGSGGSSRRPGGGPRQFGCDSARRRQLSLWPLGFDLDLLASGQGLQLALYCPCCGRGEGLDGNGTPLDLLPWRTDGVIGSRWLG